MKQIIATMALLMAAMLTTTAAFGQTGTTIDVDNPASGTGYSVSNGVITITSNGEYTLQGSTTSNRVVVATGVTATVTLRYASITSSVGSALELSAGASVKVNLVGSSRLMATTWQTNPFSAGLQVTQGASVVIEGSGTLYAKGCGQEDVNGNDGGAGIGGAGVDSEPGKVGIMPGAITINSGTITAEGGDGGAGIGGGSCGGAGTIIINGGAVTANGGYTAAGIGSGLYSASVNNITINGGVVTVTAGMYAAAIGGGAESPGGNITITGGTVTATSSQQGAAIGGGTLSSAGVINISGGAITATGGDGGSGIGTGMSGTGGAISITGGDITAIGGITNAAISSGGGDILIAGGNILAISLGGAGNPAAIGGGYGSDAGNIRISGGNIYAYGCNGPGIGGYVGTSGGNIQITAGTIMANRIGVGNGGLTPTSVASGLILTDEINTTDFGNAAVQTGLSITEAFIRTAAANAWRETVEQPEGATDTIVQIIHDTVRITLHDTIVETQIIHDTLVETQIVHDTIEIPEPYEVVVVVDLSTGDESVVQDTLQIVSIGNDLYFLRGLDIDKEFAVFDSQGALVYRGTANPIRIPGSGMFIVGQGGKWWKFVK